MTGRVFASEFLQLFVLIALNVLLLGILPPFIAIAGILILFFLLYTRMAGRAACLALFVVLASFFGLSPTAVGGICGLVFLLFLLRHPRARGPEKADVYQIAHRDISVRLRPSTAASEKHATEKEEGSSRQRGAEEEGSSQKKEKERRSSHQKGAKEEESSQQKGAEEEEEKEGTDALLDHLLQRHDKQSPDEVFFSVSTKKEEEGLSPRKRRRYSDSS